MRCRRLWTQGILMALMAAIAAKGLAGTAEAQGKTLRVVMHSDLKILDPIWTTAYIVRNHGYMIYDTLFSTDEKGEIKPQMVGKHEVSADQLTHTLTLRDGLVWHDGAPVTSEDCIASIKRWGAKDATGQKLMSFVSSIEAVDAKTFVIKLKSPTGLVLLGLGKPSSSVPFMMPKRVAETDPNTQISEFIGSGPFVFKKDEWKPGAKTVYVKNEKYKPRPEKASSLAGGKVVYVDRVEWLAISDHQQAVNALLAGEIDLMEAPPHDLLPLALGDPNIKFFDWNSAGNQYTFRLNWLHPPFNNPKVREALFYAFNQEDFLKATIGNEKYYKVCKSYFPCGTTFANEAPLKDVLGSNFKKARELLKEAGYDGTPIVLMHSTDLQVLTNLAPVAKSLMEKAGFKVEMQSMDWQSVVSRRAKKDAPTAGGWHAFLTSWVAADIANPIFSGFMNAACDKAMFGWPCDAEIEKLRDAFARETDLGKQKAIADAIQMREIKVVTHIPVGQWYLGAVMRKSVSGMLPGPAPVFWNIKLD